VKQIVCDCCGYPEKLKEKNSVENILITKDLRKVVVKDKNGGMYEDYLHMYELELCADCQEDLNNVIGKFINVKNQKRT
jgi:hypothetical protein